jgi:hypothetical protein
MGSIRFVSLLVIAMTASAQHPIGFGGARVGALQPGGGLVSPIAVGAAGLSSGAGIVAPTAVGYAPRAGRPFFGGGYYRCGFPNSGWFDSFGYPYYPYLGYSLIGSYGPWGDDGYTTPARLSWSHSGGEAFPYDDGFPYYAAPPAQYSPIDKIIFPASTPETSASAPPAGQTAHSVMKDYKWNESEAPSAQQPVAFTVALKDGSKRDAGAAWVQERTLHLIDSEGREQVLTADLIDREATQRLNGQKNLSLQLPPS